MNAEIILLTKSKKYNNYCIAGINLKSGSWIRLVSNQMDIRCAVPTVDLTYQDGSEAQIFDVVQVQLTKQVPLDFQPENFGYDPEYYWLKLRRSSLNEVRSLLRQHADPYVFHNLDKRLASTFVTAIPPTQRYSLKLIYVDIATLNVERYERRLKYKLSFSHNGNYYYDFSVTDYAFLQHYQSVGSFDLKNRGLVISLGELFEFDQCHYKLIAAII